MNIYIIVKIPEMFEIIFLQGILQCTLIVQMLVVVLLELTGWQSGQWSREIFQDM